MTPEEIILARLNKTRLPDPDVVRKNLDRIIGCHCDVLQAIYDGKVQMEAHEVFIETLITKIIFASKSIHNLSLSTKIKPIKTNVILEIIDTPSMYILARSILEGFLTLEYLYFNSQRREEQIFRFKLWKISGLMTRQAYQIRVLNEKEILERKEQEKEEIEQLKAEIKKSPYFQNLRKDQVWKLDQYGLPRLISWNKLLDKSKLSSKIFKDIYGLYSDYAHSEFLSMIQLNGGYLNKENKLNISNVNLVLDIITMINAVVIEFLTKRFKSSEIIFNSIPSNLIRTIEEWSKVAQSSLG